MDDDDGVGAVLGGGCQRGGGGGLHEAREDPWEVFLPRSTRRPHHRIQHYLVPPHYRDWTMRCLAALRGVEWSGVTMRWNPFRIELIRIELN